MLKYLLLVLITQAQAKTIKVGVIDTGIQNPNDVTLCDDYIYDITNHGIYDINGHGTNISGIIEEQAHKLDYCQVVIKYYHKPDNTTLANTIKAFQLAYNLDLDIINYSSEGQASDPLEKYWITKLLDKGVIIVVPSGNSSKNLDVDCDVYPACYDKRLVVVGRTEGLYGFGTIVDFYEYGKNITGFGITLSGTSQATAIRTSKIIKELTKGKK